MSAPRVFVEQDCKIGDRVLLDRDDARHLRLVLRLKAGDSIAVVSKGNAWSAVLAEPDGDQNFARIVAASTEPSRELPVEVFVLQAVPKGMKMDDVVEKVVELGAARIVPIRCARSYGGDSPAKLARWQRIARAAAQQSQRNIIPIVEEPLSFNDAIARFTSIASVFVAHESAVAGSLHNALQQSVGKAIAAVIGPEGSFSDDEIARAKAASCHLISLGRTILRTETAAAAMLAQIAALQAWT